MPTSRSFKDEYRTNWFDDGVLDNPRVREAIKGRKRELRMNLWNHGGLGDWETFCESIALLLKVYRPEAKRMLGDSVIHASDICLRLAPSDSMVAAERLNDDIMDLWGGIEWANLVAWCAVCKAKGDSSYGCVSVWRDIPECRNVIPELFKTFDGLQKTAYNITDILEMSGLIQ